MELKTKIESMLNEVGKNSCYAKRKQEQFWVLDKTPCIVLDNPNKLEKRKCIEVKQIIETNGTIGEIGFISIDRCLIQQNNCDFLVFKDKRMIFCEDKLNMTSRDKLDDNTEYAMQQINISKQYFNEKLLGLGNVEAFIGVPDFLTKNPTSTQKLQRSLTDKHRISIKIGQKVEI
jgi:hypothetical protein